MSKPVLYIVDDDAGVREATSWVAGVNGIETECYESAESFLQSYEPGSPGCVLADITLPDMDGLTLHRHLQDIDPYISVILITGHPSIRLAVDAMKSGALDFVEKPVDNDTLLAAINRAFTVSEQRYHARAEAHKLAEPLMRLTKRERDVFDEIVKGHTSKAVGEILGISQKTVETHRAAIMQKTGAHTLADLIALSNHLCDACA